MRAPSSFHSTAAGPVFSSAAVDVGRGRGEHRRDRPPDLEPERRQRLRAAAERRLGDRAEVAAQHQRPPHGRDRHAGRLGHRVADHRGQRALAQVAEHQRAQERLLGRRRARQQRAPAPRAARPREPAPLSAGHASSAASTSATVSVGAPPRAAAAPCAATPSRRPSTRWRGAPAR